MPGFNQKGPDGVGAMTGRQGGMCRRTESQSTGSDRGDGSGRGRGMGTRRGSGQGQGQNLGQGQGVGQGRKFENNVEQQRAGIDSSEELKSLKEQYQVAQKALSMIEDKIAALENGK